MKPSPAVLALSLLAALGAPVTASAQAADSWQFQAAMTGTGCAFGWGAVVGAWRLPDYQMKPSSPIEEIRFSGPGQASSLRW